MEQSSKTKALIIGLLGFFLIVIGGGLFWFFFLGSAPVGAGWYLFSFATGLTMIVLPCTLPLAFVIVPLAMGKSAAKGLGMALAFGVGVALMLSLYGVAAAVVGEVTIGSLGAPLEVVKNWLYLVAGIFAYIFALGEIGLLKFRMPTYSGAAPAFIQKQGDFFKALFLGLFLGNVGVGCPHPATPVILTRIAASGDIFYGWLLFLVHAVGRILPLLFLALLAILGVNALAWIVARKDKVERATGWGMVFVAAFILVLGLFTHDWWVNSGQHTLFEEITQEERVLNIIGAKLSAENVHRHGPEEGPGLFGLPLWLGNWVLVFLWVLPLWWYYERKKELIFQMSEEEKLKEQKIMPWRFWFSIVFSAFLVVTFVWYLPLRFISGAGMPHMEEMEEYTDAGHMMDMDDRGGYATQYHEESSVMQGIAINLNATPVPVMTGTSTRLDFFVNRKPGNVPVDVSILEIEHEKLMHVIGIRDDMNEFFHIHPDVSTSSPGLFSVAHIFKNPGKYKIWSEIKEAGINHAFGHLPFGVEGGGIKSAKDVSYGLNAAVGNYQVGLQFDAPAVKNVETELSFDIHSVAGQEVGIENYLGAPMHLSIIKDDLRRFIHTHPESGNHSHAGGFIPEALANGGAGHGHDDGEMPAVSDHGIDFHVTFPEAGLYRVFAQFRPEDAGLPDDEALTAAFWIKVEESKTLPISPWWINLIISAILILVLSMAMHRFLRVKPVQF